MNDTGNENSSHVSIEMPDINSPIYREAGRAVFVDYWGTITRLNEYIEFHITDLDASATIKSIHPVEIIHPGCEVEAKFNIWPEGYDSIHFYQVCSLDHQVIYGECRCRSNAELFCETCQIRHEYLFWKVIIDSNQREKYVLDSFHGISYKEITKIDFENGKKDLVFSDQPRGLWDVEHENYPLDNIDKKQDFLINLVGIKKDGQRDVLRGWKWGFDMTYRNGIVNHKPRILVESKKEIPKHLIYLPNANDCLFKFQHASKLLNKPGAIIEYPKILPDGFTTRDFNLQIINKLNQPISNHKSILILSAIIQYFLKLINIFKRAVNKFWFKNN